MRNNEMRDRLTELLRQIEFDYYEECVCAAEDGYKGAPDFAKYFVDHLLAEGVIVPPCKVGDMLYTINSNGNIVEGVAQIVFQNKWTHGWTVCAWFADYHETENEGYLYIPFSDFGKTVFLTKEEAENAPKERSER